MRTLTWNPVVLCIAAAAACAETPSAPSAPSFGSPAAATAPAAEQGYSAADRRHADCVATYPGYDPRTDRYEVRPGVTRRCPF